MTTSEHEAAAASAATPTGSDDSDTNGLSRRDVLQLAGSAVFACRDADRHDASRHER